MAKALFGTTAPTSQLRMLDEIRVLRERVAELEAALAEAERAAADRRELVVVEDAAGVGA
jgi:hypothetical protein